MVIRLVSCIVFAAGLLSSSSLYAQAPFQHSGRAPSGAQFGQPMPAQMGYPSGSRPMLAMPANPAAWSPVGYPVGPHYGNMPPQHHAGHAGPGPYRRSSNVRYYEEQLPEDHGWSYGESPLDQFIKDVATSTWFRLEYLNMNLRNVDDAKLGASLLAIDDITEDFPVTVGDQFFGTARVADLDELRLDNTNGVRWTMGIPLTNNWSIEANILSFEENSDSFFIGDLGVPVDDPLAVPIFIATSTLTNGEIGVNTFLYDVSFAARLSSDIWGAEFNFVMDPLVPGNGLKFQPLVGFRFLSFKEDLAQVGIFDQQGFISPANQLVSTIDAQTKNYLYGPQIGLRMEYRYKRLSLGFEPKIALTVNVHERQVQVERLRSEGDPLVSTGKRGERFAPIGQFNFFARLHLSRSWSFFVSSDVTVVGGISRAFDAIRYNDNGMAADADVVARQSFDNMTIKSITFGGELRFR